MHQYDVNVECTTLWIKYNESICAYMVPLKPYDHYNCFCHWDTVTLEMER